MAWLGIYLKSRKKVKGVDQLIKKTTNTNMKLTCYSLTLKGENCIAREILNWHKEIKES